MTINCVPAVSGLVVITSSPSNLAEATIVYFKETIDNNQYDYQPTYNLFKGIKLELVSNGTREITSNQFNSNTELFK